jgi:hypothetical protein
VAEAAEERKRRLQAEADEMAEVRAAAEEVLAAQVAAPVPLWKAMAAKSAAKSAAMSAAKSAATSAAKSAAKSGAKSRAAVRRGLLRGALSEVPPAAEAGSLAPPPWRTSNAPAPAPTPMPPARSVKARAARPNEAEARQAQQITSSKTSPLSCRGTTPPRRKLPRPRGSRSPTPRPAPAQTAPPPPRDSRSRSPQARATAQEAARARMREPDWERARDEGRGAASGHRRPSSAPCVDDDIGQRRYFEALERAQKAEFQRAEPPRPLLEDRRHRGEHDRREGNSACAWRLADQDEDNESERVVRRGLLAGGVLTVAPTRVSGTVRGEEESRGGSGESVASGRDLDRASMCASPWCYFRVHTEPSFGGFCCLKCAWRYDSGINCKKKHGLACLQQPAASDAPRAPPIVPVYE